MATRNIVPRANEEGNIGTSLKNWLKGWFKNLFVSNNLTDGSNDVTIAGLKDAVDKKHLNTILGTKEIDETDIGDDKVIYYDEGSGKLKYIDLPGGGDMLKSVYDTDNDDIVDKAETLNDGANNVTALETRTHLDDLETDMKHITDAQQAVLGYYGYAEDNTETTTTSQEYIEKLKLSVSPPVAGSYMLRWTCEITVETPNKDIWVKVQHNDSTIINEIDTFHGTGDCYCVASGFSIVTIESGSNDFYIYFRRTAGVSYTVKIRRARLYLTKI